MGIEREVKEIMTTGRDGRGVEVEVEVEGGIVEGRQR